MLTLRREEKKSALLIWHTGNLAEGFQIFCHFQGYVCLRKIPRSSWPGRSVGMRLVFILKEPCDAISIHDEDYGEKKKYWWAARFPDLQHPPPSVFPQFTLLSLFLNCSQTGTQENDNDNCNWCNVSGLIKSTQIICLTQNGEIIIFWIFGPVAEVMEFISFYWITVCYSPTLPQPHCVLNFNL